jgi:hypothetical protein
MAETRAASPLRTELRADVTAGRRTAGWQIGRLVIDEDELTVRSAAIRFIPARSVSRDAAGHILVRREVKIYLPVVRWRRLDVVTFGATSPFADVRVRVSPRKRVADVLRAHGYTVTGHGT